MALAVHVCHVCCGAAHTAGTAQPARQKKHRERRAPTRPALPPTPARRARAFRKKQGWKIYFLNNSTNPKSRPAAPAGGGGNRAGDRQTAEKRPGADRREEARSRPQAAATAPEPEVSRQSSARGSGAAAMSVSCGLEWVVCLGCTRWAWKRLTYIGAYDSETWPPASADEFEPVPRLCRAVLANYDDELSSPKFAPPEHGYFDIDPKGILKRATYKEVGNACPPYLVYVDEAHKEIILAVRGLNLVRNADYKVLMDNKLGMQMFDGGYVHHGLLKAAKFILERETETLRNLLRRYGPEYKLILTGHSLGSGIAALMTVLVVNNRKEFDNIPRSRVKCYALAPARCMSLNLAVKYADVINSVVLQDDFLPRTPTPLEYIFGSIFCLPCMLFLICLRDTFKQDKRKFKDPRRLYAPGRMYHIVERKFCRCGRFPPEVRTAIPVEGRFEHVVLSCSTTSDHGIYWIERESQKALELMINSKKETTPPPQQKMERLQSFEEEHKNALQRAKTLDVPHAADLSEEEIQEEDSTAPPSDTHSETTTETKSGGRTSWDELMEKLFTRDEDGRLVVNKDAMAREIVVL